MLTMKSVSVLAEGGGGGGMFAKTIADIPPPKINLFSSVRRTVPPPKTYRSGLHSKCAPFKGIVDEICKFIFAVELSMYQHQ